MSEGQHTIRRMLDTLPQIGRVEWIGLRPARRAPIKIVTSVQVNRDVGLVGDRYSGSSGKRQVTLIQYEHLAVIASTLAIKECAPELLRRNISVSGINLLSLKNKIFRLGDVTLEYTGLCHPCSFMEKTFGPGGYNAVRGHGGITARVIENGTINVNDTVVYAN